MEYVPSWTFQSMRVTCGRPTTHSHGLTTMQCSRGSSIILPAGGFWGRLQSGKVSVSCPDLSEPQAHPEAPDGLLDLPRHILWRTCTSQAV